MKKQNLAVVLILLTSSIWAQDKKTIQQVKKDYEPQLRKIKGVEGIEIGRNNENKEIIRIFVSNNTPEFLSSLPKKIEEFDVEVSSGKFKLNSVASVESNAPFHKIILTTKNYSTRPDLDCVLQTDTELTILADGTGSYQKKDIVFKNNNLSKNLKLTSSQFENLVSHLLKADLSKIEDKKLPALDPNGYTNQGTLKVYYGIKTNHHVVEPLLPRTEFTFPLKNYGEYQTQLEPLIKFLVDLPSNVEFRK